jgi:hypothetical protein
MPVEQNQLVKPRVYPKLPDSTYQVVIDDVESVEKVSKNTQKPYTALRFRLTVLSTENDAYGHRLMFTNVFPQLQNKDGSSSPLARIIEAVTGKAVDIESKDRPSADIINSLIGKQLAVTTTQVTTDSGIFERCEPFGPATSQLPPLDEQKSKEAYGKRLDKMNADSPKDSQTPVVDF